MSRVGNFTGKLYRGDISFNIVGRKKLWYSISAVILLLAIGGLVFRGLNLGIEFKGGAEFEVPSSSCTVAQVRGVAAQAGADSIVVQELGDKRIRVQTEALKAEESTKLIAGLADTCKVPASEIKVQLVGPSWGSEITKKALLGLLVFMVAVVIFLSIYFEWRMAVAALVALIHDVVITIGIYALVGFEVTPATVIGVLTILGFSLYDTVVVFDKIKENTRGILGQSRMTYSEAANLALNQTLIRSINTSIVALLPVAGILFVGVGLLGAGTLKDLALALFIGLLAGTYSSLFVATPFLCQIKEREPAMRALTKRVQARRTSAATPVGAGVGAAAAGGPQTGSRSGTGGQAGANVAAPPPKKERTHRTSGGRSQPKNAPRSKRGNS